MEIADRAIAHLKGQSGMDKDLVKKVTHLCGEDRKMLLLNGRYYCHFVGQKKELEPDCNYVFFSGSWKD